MIFLGSIFLASLAALAGRGARWRDRLARLGAGVAFIIAALGGPVCPAPAEGRDLYVDPTSGDDAADGLSALAQGTSGPKKTIAAGVRLALPGDTLHLAHAVYHESIDLTGRSGEPGKPLVIDGHGAVLDGLRAIDVNAWKEVAPGLYRNTELFAMPLRNQEDWVRRWFMVFDGKVNRMGRCMKGDNAPYKAPADLKPGEWTYQQHDEHAFYIRVDPSRKLADCLVEVPWEVNGVSVHGANHDLAVRNLTARRVINDGYNISPVGEGAKIRDVTFENVAAIECGDDGLSAHGDSSVRIDGFYATGNGTGICTTGDSINNRLHLTHNVGWELFFYESPVAGEITHEIRNSFIDCGAANAFLALSGRQPGDSCVVKLTNVVLAAKPNGPSPTRTVRIGEKVRLEASALTSRGLSFDPKGGGLRLSDSIVVGDSQSAIVIGPTAAWKAERNIYDLGRIQIGAANYGPADFDAYQRATGQDASSKWEKLKEASDFLLQGKPVGADRSLIPRLENEPSAAR